jgi:aspartate carbamoyltransferase catalytic subunit
LINAGDGTNAHPSQALLDLMTIQEVHPDVSNLKIAIIGNIKHSRVANSLQQLFAKIGIKQLTLVAPKIWQPTESFFGRTTEFLEEGICGADVIICLRVQKERLGKEETFDPELYTKSYGLTEKTCHLISPKTMIMHPGPINRGLEIDSKVADGAASYILKQVKNGVYMRMAIIEHMLLQRK